ncbi:universal stress protein UspE [Glaciecola sp. XM2]|uniref:universal stress protein UspE n=1 Tax=Glaciecola sp. XM2 TaxID=1914931 RepID=UPI001BDEEAA1|nr:universal stress protein UspE [Glaciecola sp. XM2]MBT1449634.1 universal stress protein UspE [Glaciecola sp. XM2]
MLNCSRILVVFDPYHKEQPAFDRACFLAKKLDASLLLVSCIYDETYDMTNFLTSEQRVDMKTALINTQNKAMHAYIEKCDGVKVEAKAVWHKSLYRGIVDVASHEHCDLIVKSTKQHTKLAQKLFTPNDWNLLRYSPVNVLMVKEHDWPENGKIIASVSIDANDKTHNLLSERVTQISIELADLVAAQVHVANTFAGAPVHVAVEVPSFNAQAYNQDIEAKHKKDVAAMCERYSINSNNQHVAEGLPEDVIPALCDELDAELLVLGSVGRRGLSAALLGNTAEHIIDKVNCDTLVVKPQV